MKIDTEIIRPIRLDDDLKTVKIIDQRRLPHEFVTVDLKTMDDAVMAIIEMYVRGAPLIGVTAAYGVFLAALNCAGNQLPDDYIVAECRRLKAARPTAVNLSWAVDWMLNKILTVDGKEEKIKIARRAAGDLADSGRPLRVIAGFVLQEARVVVEQRHGLRPSRGWFDRGEPLIRNSPAYRTVAQPATGPRTARSQEPLGAGP